MSRVEKPNNAAGPIAATRTKRPNYPFLLTDVDQSVTMKLPASLSSDPYRHRIGTRYFLHRNPQSNLGYAARGERGDPRGRKSSAGLQLTNASFPARAEGEKRLRSATRNP
jgi:hypothetical protein